MKRRYYPSPDLDRAVYHLQNHPELAGKDTKVLQHVTLFDGKTAGRNAWERAKKVYAVKIEERKLITLDLKTRLIAYIGDSSRLVTRSKSVAYIRCKLDALAQRGYVEVFRTHDKKFFVFELPAAESEKAA